ncbi:MAG TPA: hypothetical protein VNG33_14675 [Polyangiaceae bacterium]|nr:hypothetical protein [Polyangiaceae bacterium]
MKERNIALSSLALGLAALGLVATIHSDPLAFTHGAPSAQVTEPPRRIQAAEIAPVWTVSPIEAAPPTQPTNGLVLPPVLITPLRRAVQTEREERPLEPCSVWREIGPKYVTDGVPTGTKWVRDLC